ncbi:unnamed protein product [Ectocarpus sp. 13 AM-2016]
MGESRTSLIKGRDPEDVMSLARCLGRCKSTPDLSYTAASLLSKTLTARATRLESTASKARLAAEKEAYRRETVEKRRRALSPKNSSDFMRQTLRDREQARESNRLRVERRRPGTPVLEESAAVCRRGTRRPKQGPLSDISLQLRFGESDHDVHSICSSLGDSLAHGSGAGPPQRTEQTLTPHLRSTLTSDCVGLEDDDDIRVLLHRAYSSSSSTRSESSGLSGKPKPASGHSYGRSRCTAESPLLHGRPSAATCKGYVQRPHTAGATAMARSFDGKKLNPTDVAQLRREILICSLGEKRHLHLYPTESFETTAMGRKARCRTPGRKAEVIPWMPAKTTDSRDRLQRSRMLMNQRPVVSKLHAWT